MSLLRNKAVKRKSSGAIRILGKNVGKSLDKSIENEISNNEKEQEHSGNCFSKVRMKGRKLLHNRLVLFIIVLLCVIDCILVIGELILDMHAIKEMGEKDHNTHDKCNKEVEYYYHPDTGKADEPVHTKSHHKKHHHSLAEKVAHGLHYASISILTILVIETFIKIICFGSHFLNRKFEIWDAIVVVVSFVLDLVFIEGTTSRPLQESAYILSFILPWRVIRVVNSMIVALFDHEHIKLMLMFKSKKYLNKQIDDMCEDIVMLQKQLATLKVLCVEAGIPDWKIAQDLGKIYSASKKRKHALTTLVSTSVGMAVNSAPQSASNGKKGQIVSSDNKASNHNENKAEDRADVQPEPTTVKSKRTDKLDGFREPRTYRPRRISESEASEIDEFSDAVSRMVVDEENVLLCPVPGRYGEIV